MVVWALCIVPLISNAEDVIPSQKQYPPYSEVWGYDFSEFPAVKRNATHIISYNIPNGDYWFFITKDFEYTAPYSREYKIYKENLVKFFESKNYEVDKNFNNKFFSDIPKNTRAVLYKPKSFSNSDVVKREGSFEWPYYINSKFCPDEQMINTYMAITDKEGKVKSRYTVVVALPEPIKEEFPKDFLHNDCGSLPRDRVIYRQLFTLDDNIIMLEDDTFILYGDKNLIIRFDKDFKTKFKTKVNYKTRDGRTLKTNFMVIPRDEIEKMYDKIVEKDLPRVQTIQDMVMDYMIKHQDE